MFHVKDDFAAGAPISQVPASWFNKVAAFLNNLIGGDGITIDKPETGPRLVRINQSVVPSKETATPENHNDTPTSASTYDTNGETWTWKAGGSSGLSLDAYFKIGDLGTNYHLFQRCRLTISKDGLVVAAAAQPERVRIKA